MLLLDTGFGVIGYRLLKQTQCVFSQWKGGGRLSLIGSANGSVGILGFQNFSMHFILGNDVTKGLNQVYCWFF